MALGRTDAIRGRHRRALAAFDEARGLLADVEDRGLLARNATLRCYSLRPLGRLQEAREEGLRAIGLATGDLGAVAMAEQVYGSAAVADGAVGEGILAYRRAAEAARAANVPRTEGIALVNLAMALAGVGELASAEVNLRAARTLFAAADDRFHLARTTLVEGELARIGGRWDAAEACLNVALAAAEEEGDVGGALYARASLVEVALGRGDITQAASALDEADAIARFVDDVSWGPRLEALNAQMVALGAPRSDRRGVSEALAGQDPAGQPETTVRLRLAPDGRRVQIDGRSWDFGRRGPLRRVLVALARARVEGTTLSAASLLEAGWPGERMTPDSGAGRVYTTIGRLRAFGLEGVLVTLDEGYALAARREVRIDPEM